MLEFLECELLVLVFLFLLVSLSFSRFEVLLEFDSFLFLSLLILGSLLVTLLLDEMLLLLVEFFEEHLRVPDFLQLVSDHLPLFFDIVVILHEGFLVSGCISLGYDVHDCLLVFFHWPLEVMGALLSRIHLLVSLDGGGLFSLWCLSLGFSLGGFLSLGILLLSLIYYISLHSLKHLH